MGPQPCTTSKPGSGKRDQGRDHVWPHSPPTVLPTYRPTAPPVTIQSDLSAALGAVRDTIAPLAPRIAVVLGSGLGSLADSLVDPARIPYSEIEGFPATSVTGHSGELLLGFLEQTPVLLQSGRFHLYEGHDPATVALPVRLFSELGVSFLIVTNAAGGLAPFMQPPALMLIADHVNLMWRNPLIGEKAGGEYRWPDMCDAYDKDLRGLAAEVARDKGITLHEGVYGSVLGPSFETPSEVRMLRRLGCDAVGMSTVPEVVTARARGMKVLGLSSITNAAAGISRQPLSHREVLEAGRRLSGDLEMLVRGVARHLAPA